MRKSTLVFAFLLALGCQKAPAQPAGAQPASPAPAGQPGAAAAPAQVPGQPGQPGAPDAPPPAKPVPSQLPEVVARVNGEAITKAEFEEAVKTIEQRAGRPVPPEQRDAVFRGMLDQLINLHVLKQEIKTRKVSVADTEIDARINEIRQQFKSEEEFKQALAARSTSVEALKADARDEMAITKMVEAEVAPKVTVDDAAVKSFYDSNPQQFQQPESWRASHILIKFEDNATDVQKKAAKVKAESILKQVQAGGDFAALAKQHSQDGSAQAGGDLNYFQKGQMVAPFEQATAALKPGQVSGVVETQFGYHIIKLTDHKDPRTVPLAEVAPRIGEFLKMRGQQQKAGEFIDGLKAKSKIEILI